MAFLKPLDTDPNNTDPSHGQYTTPTLHPGSYYIQSYSTDGTYENEYYPATNGRDTTPCTGATKINIGVGDAKSGYDLSLYSKASTTISGIVFKYYGTTPITGEDLYINVYESKTAAPYYGKWVTSAVVSKTDGTFKAPFIPKGKYKLQSYDEKQTYLNQWYGGYPSSFYPRTATVVDTTTAFRTDINFYLYNNQ